MKISTYLIAILFLNSLSAFAQNPTNGGGKGPTTFAATYEEEMLELNKEVNSWLSDFKKEWSDCYTSKVKSRSIVDLHMFLAVTEAFTPPKLRKRVLKEQAAKSKVIQDTAICNDHKEEMFSCAFQNYYTNKKLEALLDHPYFRDHLKTKEVTDKDSQDKLIEFFRHQIGTVKDAKST